jgi:hypothetical protein
MISFVGVTKKSTRLAAAKRVVDSVDDKAEEDEEDEDEEDGVNDDVDDDNNAIIDMDNADFGMASPPKSPTSKDANPGRFLKTMPATSTSSSSSSSSSSKMITVSIKRRASRLALRVPPPEVPPVVSKEVKGTSAKIEYGVLRGSGKFHVGEDIDVDFK